MPLRLRHAVAAEMEDGGGEQAVRAACDGTLDEMIKGDVTRSSRRKSLVVAEDRFGHT